jgi:hypothetical protein
MSDQTITQLTAISALDEDDVLLVVEDGTAKKVTVAQLRTALAAGIFSGARVGISGDVTPAGSTVAWDTEIYDTDGYHSNVTNNSRLTVPVAGIYAVSWGMRQSGATTNFITLYKNVESDPTLQDYTVNATSITSGYIPVSCSANDYFTLSVAAGTWKAGGSGYPPAWFAIERLDF